MASNEQVGKTATCAVAGLGCLIAIVLLALMSRLPFEDYDLAFSYQLPLTLSGDLGCFAGVLMVMALARFGGISSPVGAYAVVFVSSGLAFASLLKMGFIVPTTPASLVAGDFFGALFALACAYCWWIVYASMGERLAVPRLALAMVVGGCLFFLVHVVPTAFGRIAGAVVLPLAMCLCFLPSIADRQGLVFAGEPGADSQKRRGGKGSSLPRVVLITVALSFFVADLELDLFPVSLYFEDILLGSLPLPALYCLGFLMLFAVVLYLFARHGCVPLPLLYTTGFILTAAGYLSTPYRLQGGLPLAASEAGRIVIALFVFVLVMRFMEENDDRGSARRLFLRTALTTFAAMLAADAIVVVMQMQPGFDYGDFVFRTVFSGLCVAVLVLLLLGPLPRTDVALRPVPSPASSEPVLRKGSSEGFARRYGLSARETEVLALLANGRDVPYIEQELVLAKSTVKTHIKHIYEKCGVSSRQKLLDALEDFEG